MRITCCLYTVREKTTVLLDPLHLIATCPAPKAVTELNLCSMPDLQAAAEAPRLCWAGAGAGEALGAAGALGVHRAQSLSWLWGAPTPAAFRNSQSRGVGRTVKFSLDFSVISCPSGNASSSGLNNGPRGSEPFTSELTSQHPQIITNQ